MSNANLNEDFVIVVIGETGVGKSTLANVLLGKNHFKTSPSIDACTLKAEYCKGKFLGLDNEEEVIVVDTQGYTDPLNRDYENTREMIKLIKSFPLIKVFLIVFNGEIIRWNAATKSVLEIFHNTFPDFWQNAHFVINFWAEDDRSVKRREMQGRSQGSLRQDIAKSIFNMFGVNHVKTDFIDALAYNDAAFPEEGQKLTSKLKDLKLIWRLNKGYSSIDLKPGMSEQQKKLKELEEKNIAEKKKNEELIRQNTCKEQQNINLNQQISNMNSCLSNLHQQISSLKAENNSRPRIKYKTVYVQSSGGNSCNPRNSRKSSNSGCKRNTNLQNKLKCLSNGDLKDLCEKLDAPRSGNKGQLIGNIVSGNSANKVYNKMKVSMLKDICGSYEVSKTGKKVKLINKVKKI